jgi:hypothetical protein
MGVLVLWYPASSGKELVYRAPSGMQVGRRVVVRRDRRLYTEESLEDFGRPFELNTDEKQCSFQVPQGSRV